MNFHPSITPGLLRLAAICSIIAGTFLIGVVLQAVSGWIPETDLQNGTMYHWLQMVTENRFMALAGVAISIICIILFLPVGLTLYRLLPLGDSYNVAGISFYTLGTTLALASFTFGFAFTWALTDLMQAPGSRDLAALATVGMRGAVWTDDLATCLLGIGQAMFGLSAMRTKLLPKWLCRWGMLGGILVTLVLLRYLVPLFAFAAIGYPVIVLWWVFTGINLLRKARRMPAAA